MNEAPSISQKNEDGLWLHDNDQEHTAKATKEPLKQKHIKVMEQFQDLGPFGVCVESRKPNVCTNPLTTNERRFTLWLIFSLSLH